MRLGYDLHTRRAGARKFCRLHSFSTISCNYYAVYASLGLKRGTTTFYMRITWAHHHLRMRVVIGGWMNGNFSTHQLPRASPPTNYHTHARDGWLCNLRDCSIMRGLVSFTTSRCSCVKFSEEPLRKKREAPPGVLFCKCGG